MENYIKTYFDYPITVSTAFRYLSFLQFFFLFNIFISARRLFFREFIEILPLSVFLVLSSSTGPKFIFIDIKSFIPVIFAGLNFISTDIKSLSSPTNVRVSAVKIRISNISEIILPVYNFLAFSFAFVLEVSRSSFFILYSRYYPVEIYSKTSRVFIVNSYKFSIDNA